MGYRWSDGDEESTAGSRRPVRPAGCGSRDETTFFKESGRQCPLARPEQRRGVQRPPPFMGTSGPARQVDGAPPARLPDQPGRGRRRRPRDLREAARPDRRPRPGPAQRERRHLARPDAEGALTRSTRCSSVSATCASSSTTAPSAPTTRTRSAPRRAAHAEITRIGDKTQFNGNDLLNGRAHQLPGRRQRQPEMTGGVSGVQLFGTGSTLPR